MTTTAAERGRVANVLLVEDSRSDARLTLEMLAEGTVAKSVAVAHDGEAALAMLRSAGKPGGTPRPDLVILDLNLPGRDGREVLAQMKSDPLLRAIPVVVLTTSSAPADVRRAYDLHANCYVVKPLGLDDFAAAIRAIEHFWLAVARRPADVPERFTVIESRPSAHGRSAVGPGRAKGGVHAGPGEPRPSDDEDPARRGSRG